MRKILLLLVATMSFVALYGQDLTGQWNGLLKIQGTQLRLVFNVTKTTTGIAVTMDSPDQGAKGIPASAASFTDSVLKMEVAAAGIRYQGILTKNDQIVGEFRQSTYSFPLTLSRTVPVKSQVLRPQEPIAPFPYRTEEVRFTNTKDQVVLSGTLSLPQNGENFPAVVLISGSGPQNRDEELMGHKPFLVLADFLTKKGIAVLRFDDRGVGQSTGDFAKGTTLDFSNDVEAAVEFLLTRKEIDRTKLGLIGHSEGGIIAPIVAAKNKTVRYIVLMAGVGVPCKELLFLQQNLIGKVNGMDEKDLAKAHSINQEAFRLVQNATNDTTLKRDLNAYLLNQIKDVPLKEKPPGVSDQEMVAGQVDQLISPWFRFFVSYDPSQVLRSVKCPVLALNGSKDLQVPPRENLSAIKSNLEKGGNKKVTIREYPNLNHLFQTCSTGSPKEYAEIQQTISPQVLDDISNWILKQAN